jgi:hypothetical protein
MTAERVLVLRPGAMIRPRADGLFVRALLGERLVRSPWLAERWHLLASALEAGVPSPPAALAAPLVAAGAAVLVGRRTAASTVPWHRYALTWAEDPDRAISDIRAGTWRADVGEREAATIRACVDDWQLPAVELRAASGCRIERRGSAAHVIIVDRAGRELVVRRGDAASGITAARDPGPAAPARRLAAGAALSASLALASGPCGWTRPSLPIAVDGDRFALRDGDGWSTR